MGRESVSMQSTQHRPGHKKEHLTDKPNSFIFTGCISTPRCSSMLEAHRLELAELTEMLIQIPKAILLCWPVQRLHQIALLKPAPSQVYFWFRDLYTDLYVVPGVGMLLACSCSRRYSKLNRNASNRSKNLKRNRELQVNKWCFISHSNPKAPKWHVNCKFTQNLCKTCGLLWYEKDNKTR